MREDYIINQKQIIKQEVERVVDLISYKKTQSKILTKKEYNAALKPKGDCQRKRYRVRDFKERSQTYC